MNYRGFILSCGAALALSAGTASFAQASSHPYDISPQELKYSLRDIARQSGLELVAPSAVLAGKIAPALHGNYTTAEALDAVLKGSDLIAEIADRTIFIRGRSATLATTPGASDIVVTGSRIRGGVVASNVITTSQEGMRDAGNISLADAVRALPQNFGGGQSPGIAFGVPNSSGENVGSASAINLRGLGQDATLTLLNGHRLAYGGYRQTIDISAIPFSAVDRIEIVPDGASALYGSDAVAGVANVILKGDYDGLETSARFGASTDGGNVQQEYGVQAGKTWSSGGFLLSYDFERDTAIDASQRSYTASVNPGLTLYPALKHHDVLFTGHQEIAPGLTFGLDVLFNQRHDSRRYSLTGTPTAPYFVVPQRTTSFSGAPTLSWMIAPGWSATLLGTFGIDEVHYGTDQRSASATTVLQRGCFCNKAHSIEAAVTGDLFVLPGGAAKIAAGGGYRSNSLHAFLTVGGTTNIRRTQPVYYGFGELNLPFISPDLDLPWAYRLILTAALRYESYPGIDQVATPKLGGVYAPSADIDLKGSWGRSFKAPTLYQLYNVQNAQLRTARSVGAASAATTATALVLAGGNPALAPERATTWSTTVALHPQTLSNARFELSYFHIRYRNRIVAPISFLSQALSNPIYADLVNFSPSDADKAAAIAGRTFFNFAGAPYSPANVIAIVDSRSANAAGQTAQGIDGYAEYSAELGELGSLTATASATYLDSRQRLSALQPTTQLSGVLFNPPHVRARGGLVWKPGQPTLSAFLNFTGGVTDTRTTPNPKIGSMTTLDLALRFPVRSSIGLFNGLEIDASVQNFFNAKPTRINTNLVYTAAYDSTNFTPFGRFVSVGVRKRW